MKKYYSLYQEGSEATIHIYGNIVSWEWFESDVSSYTLSKELDGIDADAINVYINSYGGEVAEGLAIYNSLKRHKAKVRTVCDGFACSADTPTSIIADKMGLTAPFKSAKETTNVFSQQAVAMAKDGKKTVAWDFVYIPSEEWKKNLKQALIAYAADNTKWDGVKNAFVDGWKTEKAASE